MKKTKYIGERKTVLLGERNIQAVVGSGSLQFQIERAAEALSQREAPCFIDTSAERRVNHQLHSAALIEKAFGDVCFLRRYHAENRAARHHVFCELLGAGIIEAAFIF